MTCHARHRADRARKTPDQEQPDWSQILTDAVTKPGVISTAYTAFWNYSVGNQLLALFECLGRKIEPGPIHTFAGWQKLGRIVRKGEKAITLCVPRTVTKRPTSDQNIDAASETSDSKGQVTFTVFAHKPHWFVLSQTDGEPYVPLALPAWNETAALGALGITRVPFAMLDGNCQGYATGKQFAVSPVAHLPHRTCLHEIAHILLGHTGEQERMVDGEERTPRDIREVEAEATALICCQSLGLPGEAFSRGYLQHWLGAKKIEERIAQRIFKAADSILRAGRPATDKPDS